MQLVPSKGKHTNIVLTRNDLSVKLKAVANGTSTYYSIYYMNHDNAVIFNQYTTETLVIEILSSINFIFDLINVYNNIPLTSTWFHLGFFVWGGRTHWNP